jgi:two-component sensor histidine kinase
VGALNAYYRPGHDPDEGEVAFLASMADHAAVAVEHARLLAESRGRARLEERYRLARDLHDSACQQLFSLALHIRAAQLTLPRRGPEDEVVRRSLQTLDQLAHAALEDMRGLIFELHPKVLHDEGLGAAVRQQAASAAARVGLQVSVEVLTEGLEVDSEAELDAYRLVQEALHNSVKHADATAVRICVGPDATDPATLVLEIADDGRGFDPATRSPGLGLTGGAARRRADHQERTRRRHGRARRRPPGPAVRGRPVRGGGDVTAEAPDRIRVFVVDDHAVVRLGLRTFLSAVPEVELVGEATGGPAASTRWRSGGASRTWC